MGNIGPERRRIEVLPQRAPAAPAEPAPAEQPAPAEPARDPAPAR